MQLPYHLCLHQTGNIDDAYEIRKERKKSNGCYWEKILVWTRRKRKSKYLMNRHL